MLNTHPAQYNWGKKVESIIMADAERASSLAFCRDTITRIADKGHLQRAHIETLLSERVRIFGTQDIRCTKKSHTCASEASSFSLICESDKHKNSLRSQCNELSLFCAIFLKHCDSFWFHSFFFFKTLGFLPPIFQTFRPQKYGQVKARRMDRSAQGEHEVSVK